MNILSEISKDSHITSSIDRARCDVVSKQDLCRFINCITFSNATKIKAEWDVIDEGPMTDILAIEAEYHDDGCITLHQTKYIESMLARY